MRKQVEPLTGELAKEFKTIVAMTHIYCRAHHQAHDRSSGTLCPDCQDFTEFAEFRLVKCPYGQIKPTCKYCPVHCYRKDMKALARTIMIYSGPRMLLKHPLLAIRHLLHDRRPVPELPKKQRKQAAKEAITSREQ